VISQNLAKPRKRFEKKHHLKDNMMYEVLSMFFTFMIVCLGLVLFRAESIGQAWGYVCGMIDKSLFSIPWLKTRDYYIPKVVFAFIMFVIEWLQRGKEHGLELGYDRRFTWLRFLLYLVIIFLTWIYSEPGKTTFIYFQF